MKRAATPICKQMLERILNKLARLNRVGGFAKRGGVGGCIAPKYCQKTGGCPFWIGKTQIEVLLVQIQSKP